MRRTAPCQRSAAAPPRVAGTTLVELVFAIAIVSGVFLALLVKRTEVVERTGDYMHEQRLQFLTQEKLDQVIYGVEEETSGTFMLPPEANWNVQAKNISNSEHYLLECTITVTYRTVEDKDREYRLTSWIIPDPSNRLLLALPATGSTTTTTTTGGG